jgi:hypothetical protein
MKLDITKDLRVTEVIYAERMLCGFLRTSG